MFRKTQPHVSLEIHIYRVLKENILLLRLWPDLSLNKNPHFENDVVLASD